MMGISTKEKALREQGLDFRTYRLTCNSYVVPVSSFKGNRSEQAAQGLLKAHLRIAKLAQQCIAGLVTSMLDSSKQASLHTAGRFRTDRSKAGATGRGLSGPCAANIGEAGGPGRVAAPRTAAKQAGRRAARPRPAQHNKAGTTTRGHAYPIDAGLGAADSKQAFHCSAPHNKTKHDKTYFLT